MLQGDIAQLICLSTHHVSHKQDSPEVSSRAISNLVSFLLRIQSTAEMVQKKKTGSSPWSSHAQWHRIPWKVKAKPSGKDYWAMTHADRQVIATLKGVLAQEPSRIHDSTQPCYT